MIARDILVIGASTGGAEAMIRLVSGLPPDLDAAVFVVHHFPSTARSQLPEILKRWSPMAVVRATHGEPVTPGRIVVAQPDHHLELGPDGVRVVHGPRENGFRPAIDPLFGSAARSYGARVIGVLLSGALGDGIAGLMAIRNAGGLAVLQDPDDAEIPDLPSRARELAGADHVVRAADMGALLARLVREPIPPRAAPPPPPGPPDPITDAMRAQTRGERDGEASTYTCPDCGGTLWQVGVGGGAVRFQCHVGHGYFEDQLYAEKAAELEKALWVSVRTFRERATLARQLADQERQRGRLDAAERFDDQATVAERNATIILERLLVVEDVPVTMAR